MAFDAQDSPSPHAYKIICPVCSSALFAMGILTPGPQVVRLPTHQDSDANLCQGSFGPFVMLAKSKEPDHAAFIEGDPPIPDSGMPFEKRAVDYARASPLSSVISLYKKLSIIASEACELEKMLGINESYENLVSSKTYKILWVVADILEVRFRDSTEILFDHRAELRLKDLVTGQSLEFPLASLEASQTILSDGQGRVLRALSDDEMARYKRISEPDT